MNSVGAILVVFLTPFTQKDEVYLCCPDWSHTFIFSCRSSPPSRTAHCPTYGSPPPRRLTNASNMPSRFEAAIVCTGSTSLRWPWCSKTGTSRTRWAGCIVGSVHATEHIMLTLMSVLVGAVLRDERWNVQLQPGLLLHHAFLCHGCTGPHSCTQVGRRQHFPVKVLIVTTC